MDRRRIYVRKKEGFNLEAGELKKDLRDSLRINALENVIIYNIYEISGLDEGQFNEGLAGVFYEEPVDEIFFESPSLDAPCFAVEYLPGQFDNRADSAEQCLHLKFGDWNGSVKTGKLLVFRGIGQSDLEKIKSYYINDLEMREKDLSIIQGLEEADSPDSIPSIEGLIDAADDEIPEWHASLNLAMTAADLKFCRDYFRDEEKRNPTETELRVLDSYWSDHCRHTTFETEIENIEYGTGEFKTLLENTFQEYLNSRKKTGRENKPVSLMDLATISMREMFSSGELDDLDKSEEINACSLKVPVKTENGEEDWLVMFKNETHNHPTEIEPFGGASTCIGGAIRDPLSGRSYVYQAMRVTGSADPTVHIDETMEGKLPQKKITTGAAHGYSSYGNQIGLATSYVREIYDEGYKAKRMEVGAVVGAAPAVNVIRETPVKGDVVILLGGKTGRDGIGGATGSSKEHTTESLDTCSAEVQKGNAPEERKIQRLFRKKKVTSLIRRCNDFGAGGVSVAIGELSRGLQINLDKVPVKYSGLNGTELAISESQERMAVVVHQKDARQFIAYADEENLQAVEVAVITDNDRLVMTWKGETIVNLSRRFLDTNGVRNKVDLTVAPVAEEKPFAVQVTGSTLVEKFSNNLKTLNNCSQNGLSGMFDSTIGSGTVLLPYGGKFQNTENECSIHKIPVGVEGSSTCSAMSYGYNPVISRWSPFHGGAWAIVESLTKLAASGADPLKARLSLQEYFRKPGTDKEAWGEPFSALLGAYYVQNKLRIPAIGGKDSMSGTFHDLTVPPTLISFALSTMESQMVISSDFKRSGNQVYLLELPVRKDGMPDLDKLKNNFELFRKLAGKGIVFSAASIRQGGLAEAVARMSFGNKTGFTFSDTAIEKNMFDLSYGSILFETSHILDFKEAKLIGKTVRGSKITFTDGTSIDVDALIDEWRKPLDKVFPHFHSEESKETTLDKRDSSLVANRRRSVTKSAEPKVVIPVFPGTNCEFDSSNAFIRAGAQTVTPVFRNADSKAIGESLEELKAQIDGSQILFLAGGFSAADEPDGSGKFITSILQNPMISDAVMSLLDRDGLILGICNGFQALVKSGLLPFGQIGVQSAESATLYRNQINRHVSKVVTTRTASVNSPWLAGIQTGDLHSIPVSHGEGRFMADSDVIGRLFQNGQVAFQYSDFEGNPTMDPRFNPNGSVEAIEGIISPDGRILGKMGHSERTGRDVLKNISGNRDQKIFESGVKYFS
ncbi:phosphoribosylformylglycinamidine synthase [Spirochaeta isovalerica]|uniref:Phosphoribosylformylglycinamidine synthase n=1 Tax=Spirochaeta isovalerica TaxID=150 RepID=A0A841R102_9SPIO|nr:phosphoribosylformylglycinamidine synthase [Spirochaeta isovalerica]MBB6478634.1 phosphoribosylformylglycinamidine synthase [Spirochaeta isovalerica]